MRRTEEYARPCSECGAPFIPYRPDCQTCGGECSNTRRRRMQSQAYIGGKLIPVARSAKPKPQPAQPTEADYASRLISGMDADMEALANWGLRYEAI